MTSTLFVDTDPQVQSWLDRRRELGQDGRDEVWQGVYHVVPHERARNGIMAVQLSDVMNGPRRAAGLTPGGLCVPSAPLVVEVPSPRDEAFAEFGLHAAHGVEGLLR